MARQAGGDLRVPRAEAKPHLLGIMATTRYIDYRERELLLSQLPEPRDKLLVQIGLSTGLRVGSILSLRWRQLWQEGGSVGFLEVPRRFLKGGQSDRRRRVRSRRVPINASLAAAIRAYATSAFGGAEPPPEEWVFRSPRRDGPISRQQAYNIVAGAASRAGLEPGVAPHALRRAYGQDVYDATGHDLVAAQLLLGHSSPLVTASYLRPRQEELDRVVLGLPFRTAGPAPQTAPIGEQQRISGS